MSALVIASLIVSALSVSFALYLLFTIKKED
jgi:hypothetical protein